MQTVMLWTRKRLWKWIFKLVFAVVCKNRVLCHFKIDFSSVQKSPKDFAENPSVATIFCCIILV